MSSLLKNNRPNIKPNAIIGVMPDKTVSTPMVKHTMNIGKCVTEFLNSGQIHVLCRRFTDTAVHGEEGQTYTLIFLQIILLQAEKMGIDQRQTSKWLEL